MTIQGYYYVSNRTLQVGDTLDMDDLIGREGIFYALRPIQSLIQV
nr:hypothetical protein [Paenalcaligenes hominis]